MREFHEAAMLLRDRDRSRRDGPSEPSRKANAQRRNGKENNASRTENVDRPPALTTNDRRLLADNEGCFKCREFYVKHQAKDCPKGFPKGTGYRTLTQGMADAAKRKRDGGKHKPIAAVAASTGETDSDDEGDSERPHPIAAVIGMSHPVAYVATNASSVLEEGEDSDPSVSTMISAARTQDNCAGPLRVPYLVWKCTASGTGTEDIVIDALIDTGSHAVLIRDDIVTQLNLRRRKLPFPETVTLAMDTPSPSSSIKLCEYVKLRLYDSKHRWSARVIRAIISPTLCFPVILGLPFFQHNDIVVDAPARSVVHRPSGFDLLSPRIVSTAPVFSNKSTDLHQEKQAVVRQLREAGMAKRDLLVHNTVCAIKPQLIGKQLRERVEILAAQDTLREMDAKVKEEFHDVFEAIPHVDQLPNDIYCRISLKDASKTFAT